MTYEINEQNALYPHKTAVELTPSEFYREFKHGRPDVVRNEGENGMNTKARTTKKMKLTPDMVRFIRQNYKVIGKIKLAEMFGISTAFCYKVASKRAMEDVADEGPVWEPEK